MQLPNIMGDYALSFVTVARTQPGGAETLMHHAMVSSDDAERVFGTLLSRTARGSGSSSHAVSDITRFPRSPAARLHDGVSELLERPVATVSQRAEADTVIIAGFRPVDGQGPRVDDVFAWTVPRTEAGSAPFADVLRALDDVLGAARPRG